MVRWSSGDYQIAPIAARSTAMGRWRLMPPWYWGDTACGRETIPVGDKYYACAAARRHLIRPLRGHLPLKGKANGGVSFNTADPQGEGLGSCGPGTRLPVTSSGGRLGGGGGRSETRLPWLGQAAASASAPVSVHAVLLTDNGDERLCPREDAGNHSRP